MKFLFFNLLNDGGPTFMYTTLLLLIASIVLLIKAFVKGDADGKTSQLIKHISLFALVWGFLGMMIGLISAFDAISAINGDIATPILAGGLKIALLSPAFGMLVFLVARLGLIAVALKEK